MCHGVRLDLDAISAPQHLRDFIYRGLYEEPERAILEMTLKPNDRYLEIGGGMGYSRHMRAVGSATPTYTCTKLTLG